MASLTRRFRRWFTRRFPFDALRAFYRKLRARLFTVERSKGDYLVLGAGDDEDFRDAPGTLVALAVETLGSRYYAPNWEFSYHKRGEDVNLARVFHDRREVEGETYEWFQTHVRGYVHEDGTLWLTAHEELEPTEHDREHILGVGYDGLAGLDTLAVTLDEAGLPYERRRYEG